MLNEYNIVMHCSYTYRPSEMQKKYEAIVEGQEESALAKEKDFESKFNRIYKIFDIFMNIKHPGVADINETELNNHENFPSKFIMTLPKFLKQTRMERLDIWNRSQKHLNISKKAFLDFFDRYEQNDGFV